jgi:hypothetical protein
MVPLLHAVLASTFAAYVAWADEEAGEICSDGASSMSTALMQQKQYHERIQQVSLREAPEVAEVNTRSSSSLSASQSECIVQYADGLDEIQQGLGDAIRAHPGVVVATSDRPIIFGVGSGTTGTWGLTKALHLLAQRDQKVSHWLNSPPENCGWIASLLRIVSLCPEQCYDELRSFDFTAMSESVTAVLDTPVFELFVDFFLSFPKALWILTTRPSDDWAKRRKERHLNSAFPIQEPCGRIIGKDTSEKDLAAMFDMTNNFIRCMVPAERLMELDMFSSNVTDSAVTDISIFLKANNYASEIIHGVALTRTHQMPEKECSGSDADEVKKWVSFDSC